MNNESQIRSNSSGYNEGTKQHQLIHEIYNSAVNYRYFVDPENNLLPHVHDLDDEPKHDGAPAMIIGSGPSLDLAMPHLKAWEGGILCTTSHALTFLYHGIEPDYIVALDPFCTWDEIKGVDWSQTKTKLVTQPGVWPSLVRNWPNEIVLYLQSVGRRDSYYATTQRYMYSRREGAREATFHHLIKTEVTLFAASPAAQMFIADRFGYGNIFLAGCDFAFPHGKARFTGWRPDPENGANWIEDASPYVPSDKDVLTNNGIPTHEVHLYYKKNMVSAWRLSLQNVWTTDHGAITEMPYADIEEVVRRQGRDIKGGIPKPERIKASELYLASVGAFTIETGGGLSFIETDNPLVDLPAYMAEVAHNYRCPQCGVIGRSPDDADHTGDKCNVCGAGIVAVTTVDAEENMKRIRKLVEAVGKSVEQVTSERAEELAEGHSSITMDDGTGEPKKLDDGAGV